MVWFANILLVILTFLSYISPFVDPSDSGIISIIGLGYPVLLLCHILAISFWLLAKSKRAILSLVVLLLGYQSCQRLVTFSLPDRPSSSKLALNVASYNINFSKPIALAPESDRLQLEQGFQKYLKSLQQIDILAVQEFGWRSKDYLDEALGFPYLHREEDMTVAIYSRYPFAAKGKVDFNSNIANTCLWADVVIGSDTIRVYSTHLESNRHNGKVPKVIHQEAPEEMNTATLFGLVKHYQKFTIARTKQAQLIAEHRLYSPHPAVVCGDFNDTPQSFVYGILKEGMQDSFEEEGHGLGSTFANRIPALRIDHILLDEAFEVLDHTISRSVYSDHYIQICTLEL